MHHCAVNGRGISAYIQNCFPVRIAFSQKCVVAYRSRENRQPRATDEFRIPLRVGCEGSDLVRLPYDDEDGDLDLT